MSQSYGPLRKIGVPRPADAATRCAPGTAGRIGRRTFLARSIALAGACWAAAAVPVEAAGRPARPVVLVHGYMDRAGTWYLAENAVVARLLLVNAACLLGLVLAERLGRLIGPGRARARAA